MRAIDLNALMLFQTVVHAGSLTSAAKITNLSIATISRRLTEFEKELGSALLEKTSRRLSPTTLGDAMLVHASRIAREAEIAQDVAIEVQTGMRGTLKLSVPAEFGHAWLGRAAAAFMVLHPDIKLEIQINDGAVDFSRDGCDVAIVLQDLPNTRMVRKRIATLQRGLFVSPGYLDRYGQPDGLTDLSQHRCLITELQRLNKTWTLSQKRQHRNLEPNWHATVANIGLLRELVLGGAGIGMLNDALCSNDVRAGRLVRLFPDWSGPPLTATAVIPGHRLITKRSRAFLDFIYQHTRDA